MNKATITIELYDNDVDVRYDTFEFVFSQIREGYLEGEVIQGTVRGWWSLEYEEN